jgi:hypothetical protein
MADLHPEEIKWHILKTWPEHWQAVYDGRKTFEVRKDDRGFAVGDGLHLKEWNPLTSSYTGRFCCRRVTHILQGGQFGVEPCFVVMAIR